MTEYESDFAQAEYDEQPSKRTWRERLSLIATRQDVRADTLEARYLSVLRHSLLLFASVLLLGAVGLVLWGAAKQIGSSNINPVPVTITPADIAPDTPAEAEKSGQPIIRTDPFKLSETLRKRTLSTYQKYFATFERQGEAVGADKVIQSVWPEERRVAFDQIASSQVVGPDGKPFASGEAAALYAVALSGDATREPGFTRALRAYKGAKKVRVCHDVTRQRKRTVDAWDSYSTNCSGWYYSPIGCPATRTIEEPYTVKLCEMQFPADISAPHVAMAESLEQFLRTSSTRSEQAVFAALDRESSIKTRKVSGRGNMFDGGKLFLGFLGLMLVYLLVVMERHHRALRNLIARQLEGNGPDVG